MQLQAVLQIRDPLFQLSLGLFRWQDGSFRYLKDNLPIGIHKARGVRRYIQPIQMKHTSMTINGLIEGSAQWHATHIPWQFSRPDLLTLASLLDMIEYAHDFLIGLSNNRRSGCGKMRVTTRERIPPHSPH